MQVQQIAFICGVLWQTTLSETVWHAEQNGRLNILPDHRVKRGLRDILGLRLPIVDGIKGTRKILDGAISKYHSLSYHEYAKFGGYDAALKDFRALKPKNVKTEVHDNVRETEGMVGNRKMVLTQTLTSSGDTSIKIYTRNKLKFQIKYYNTESRNTD